MNEPIDVEVKSPEPKSISVRQHQEVGHALTTGQITERLKFIKQVMSENMTEGVDYGKVPGCGDKPGLFQPGAQKLSMTFQLNPEVKSEEITDYQNYHRGYRFVVRVTNGSKFAEGVGECSTLESKYRFKNDSKTCPECKKPTVFKDREGKGWYCWSKKGGCGLQFVNGSENARKIEAQSTGKVEHDNPPDHWNTVRKMAFKRGFVHAIINATNTSELWSQDLEDLAGNGVVADNEFVDEGKPRNTPVPRTSTSPEIQQTPPKNLTANREWLLKEIGDNVQYALEFCRKCGILLPNENLEHIPDRFIPLNQEQMDLWFRCLDAFVEGMEAQKPFVNDVPEPKKRPAYVQPDQKELPTGPGSWRNTVIHYGKNAGKTLGKISQNSLAWYVNNFKITATYESGGKTYNKKPETMEKDKLFRKSLDQAQFELGIEDQVPM